MNERIATIEEFGAELIRTGDLDPLYIALTGADLERNQLRRWLFAYWCCYNAGASSWLSEKEGMDYWTWMNIMAENVITSPLNGRWPRGHERRHFRGKKAVDAVEFYTDHWPSPELLLGWLEGEAIRTESFTALRRRVMELPQFGPWIAFKVGDMMERVMGLKIDFANADVLMFEQPYKSALEVYKSRLDYDSPSYPPESLATSVAQDVAVSSIVAKLLDHFKVRNLAPPKFDRWVNIQEVETILCKWKSHNNGSYPMGLDTRELREGLHAWGAVSETAKRLHASVPNA